MGRDGAAGLLAMRRAGGLHHRPGRGDLRRLRHAARGGRCSARPSRCCRSPQIGPALARWRRSARAGGAAMSARVLDRRRQPDRPHGPGARPSRRPASRTLPCADAGRGARGARARARSRWSCSTCCCPTATASSCWRSCGHAPTARHAGADAVDRGRGEGPHPRPAHRAPTSTSASPTTRATWWRGRASCCVARRGPPSEPARRVLVIDDSVTFREALREALRARRATRC